MAGEKRSLRVTVRQLESMLRLSEAVAKLHFSPVVTREHADTAVQIFSNSMTRVRSEPIVLGGEDESMYIDADLYDVIQSHVLNRTKLLEEQILGLEDFNERKELAKMKTPEALIEWYMVAFNGDLDDEEDRLAERTRLGLILNRMVLNCTVFEEIGPPLVLRLQPGLLENPVSMSSTTGQEEMVSSDIPSLNIADGDFLSMVYPRCLPA